METQDRREQLRVQARGRVHLTWESGDQRREAWAFLRDISGQGLSFVAKGRFKPGSIVWCVAEEFSVYTRAQVCHSDSGWFKGTTGVRFLSPRLTTD